MSNPILLPCLRGSIGNWVTYTCLMRLKDIRELVSFADDIHKNKKLSKMIQRELKKDRKKEIGEYLLNEEEAFLNSLVVAVYDGNPQWHQFDTIKPNTVNHSNYETPDYALESMGYLSLTREEKIFALDGQHRLSGIQYALEHDEDLGYQQLSVTFLAHFNDDDGLKRTRRLFTTLNKKAKPVDKSAIIALDEDDLSACITRYLIEESDAINGDRIKFQAGNNISYSDKNVLTTIGNLYDIIKTILNTGLKLSPQKISNYRGFESEKNEILDTTEAIIDYFFSSFECLNAINSAKEDELDTIIDSYRNKEKGGHLLFRPTGLRLYIMALCKHCAKYKDLNEFQNQAQQFIDNTVDLDLNLDNELLSYRFWDPKEHKIMQLKADDRNHIIKEIIRFGTKGE